MRLQTKVTTLIALIVATSYDVSAFTATTTHPNTYAKRSITTELHAIGVLARKAKEMSVRKYVEDGVEENVMAKVKEMKSGLDSVSLDGDEAGPLQQALTKRKGTISLIAEYKRRLMDDKAGYIDEIFSPKIMSPTFREFGATALAVMADERMGGCTYEDVAMFVEEQKKAQGDMPGPLPVISSDLIVDELQLAQAAAVGAKAVTITLGVVSAEKVSFYLKAAKTLDLEVIVNVATAEQAQAAVDAGATLICVAGVDGAENKKAVIADLIVPEGNKAVCKIANIVAKNNQQLEEVEEAWICRDAGFNAVWVSDALYKGGSDPVEHPGAIIKSMIAKSSVKWASPKARSGKGEGAREYLGDILM
uniref:indole-3-glycerol-phosphate synthase n=1 Tax=Ditylum brightwellii TaxID=49249 RepID=A0A7S4QWQ1_9STRA|mmetsp:Transcript_6209/g.8114  ORF Transcript_6209/g.8114 Transcript_6209/m.8114 type:complete len:363 (+) Transcript_6209:138-1226(+)